MKYAFFLGCTIPYRLPGFELSTRKVAKALGIELLDLKGANCCGLPIDIVNHMASLVLSARNLCLAEEAGLNLVTICNGCAGKLAKARAQLMEDRRLREEVNGMLGAAGLEFKGKVEVKHFAKVLAEDFGVEKLKNEIKRSFDGMRVAVHYGCHVLKPSKYLNVGNSEFPTFVDDLVEITGAKSVGYDEKRLCCGAQVQGIREEIPLRLAGLKLSSVEGAGVDAMVTICPYCFVAYNRNQAAAGELVGKRFNTPVIHFTQLLGLALGIPEGELEVRESCADPQVILKFLK